MEIHLNALPMDKKKILEIVIEVLKWLVAIITSYSAGANDLFNQLF